MIADFYPMGKYNEVNAITEGLNGTIPANFFQQFKKKC